MTGKSEAPQIEQTQIEEIISRLQVKVSQLEKSIAHSKDVFRQLDEVANKLNPDSFHKNQPQCVSEACGQDLSAKTSAPQHYKSGIILKFDNCVNELSLVTKQLDEFTSEEVRQTINFFKHQI